MNDKNDSNISFGPDFMSDDIPIFQKEGGDDDWKTKSKDESEKIDEKYQQEKEKTKDNITEAGFMRLVSLIASQAYIFLGAVENPSTGTRTLHPEQARESIDSLAALVSKTEGNLSEEEDKLLKQVVSELQMLYVEATRGPSPASGSNNQPPPQS